MAPSGPETPVSLAAERERIIARLGDYFANDAISLDELERLIEQAYRAQDLPSLAALTRDLPPPGQSSAVAGAPAAVPDLYVPEESRILSIMSETKRKGVWLVPRHLDVWCVMSNTVLDLTRVPLPAGVTEIEIRAVLASVRIVVPSHVRVVNQAGSFMGTIVDRTEEAPAVGSGAPVLRLTGFAFMAEVRITPGS